MYKGGEYNENEKEYSYKIYYIEYNSLIYSEVGTNDWVIYYINVEI